MFDYSCVHSYKKKNIIIKRISLFGLADWGMTIVVFLTATEFFRIIAFLCGINSMAPATGVLLFFSSVYLIMNIKYISLSPYEIILWGFTIVGIPFISSLYSPANTIREVILQLYYFITLLVSSIYFKSNERKKLLFIILYVASIGALLSFFIPELFIPLAEISSANTSSQGRGAFGLYLQPNKCAENLVWIFLMIIVSVNKRKRIFSKYVFWLVLLLVVLTGSRGGLVVMIFITLFFLIFIKPSILNKINIARLSTALIILTATTILFIIYENNFVNPNNNQALNRYEFLINPSSIFTDQSMLMRFDAQKNYLNLLDNERMIWGYGLGAAAHYRGNSKILGSRASHNQIIENLFAYGLIGLIFLFFCGLVLWFDLLKFSKDINVPIHFLIIGILMIFFVVSNTVLGSRNLYIFIGLLYAKRIKYIRETVPESVEVVLIK